MVGRVSGVALGGRVVPHARVHGGGEGKELGSGGRVRRAAAFASGAGSWQRAENAKSG